MERHLFDADHDAFRATVRAFCDKWVVPHHDEWEAAGIVPRELWTAAGEQGLLNYVLLKKFQEGRISLRRVPFMWWAGWLDEKAVRVKKLTRRSPYPVLVHWAGPEKKQGSLDNVPNGHLLRHFESIYNSRISSQTQNRPISAWRRIVAVAAHLRQKCSQSGSL